MQLSTYIAKWGATWSRAAPTGRYVKKPTTPWPDRSYFEIRVSGVNQTEHEVLEGRLRVVVDEFIEQIAVEVRT